jgi:hypothetical protein
MGTTDFGTAQRVVEVINREVGPGTAQAVDGRLVRVAAPEDAISRVAFLGRLENLEVRPAKTIAKVIINPRTGSVVMNQTVTIESCAVAHGNLSVVINTEQKVSQPNSLAGGQTVTTTQSEIDIKQGGGSLIQLKAGVKLAEVVKAINALGCRAPGSAVHPAVDESSGRAARRARNHLSQRARRLNSASHLPIMKSTELGVQRLAIDPAAAVDLRAKLRQDPQTGSEAGGAAVRGHAAAI